MPAVSVITPTYNRPGYLKAAIESVLAQSFTDFEHIIVDDGSDSETRAVVERFDDRRIRYVYQDNAGRGAARNRGLALATGEYVAFLDDDDLYLPEKLAVQVAFLEAQPAVGLVGSFTQFIAEDGSSLGLRETWQKGSTLTLLDCLYANPLATCSVLLRRCWPAALDHWFDPTMQRAEDKDFWARLLLAGCRIEWTQDVVSAYRQHTNTSQRDQEGYYNGNLQLLDKLYARPDAPEPLRAERAALYAHFHLLNAWPAYAGGRAPVGKERLATAIELKPELLLGDPPAFLVSLIAYGQTMSVDDAGRLIETVFDELPPEAAGAQAHRGAVMSALYMHRVFAAHTSGLRPSLRDWLYGVFNAPVWLTNRGVWSILVRDILLRSSARAGAS